MRESFGSVFLYNMVIIFIVIVFAILAATLTYYKAFKINSKIINSIEKFEGYNDLAYTEIGNTLQTLGYMIKDGHSCPSTKNGGTLQKEDPRYRYCVYYFKDDNKHYSYGVITYITLDIPIVHTILNVPIYAKSSHIYRFNG